ncbi:MAG: hypothetical protein ACI361_00100 [Atopobiaceae bacterium]
MKGRVPMGQHRAKQGVRREQGLAQAGRRPDESPEEFRACARKRRYATAVEAKKAAAHGAHKKDAPQLYVYACPYCGGWHLTHRKPRS